MTLVVEVPPRRHDGAPLHPRRGAPEWLGLDWRLEAPDRDGRPDRARRRPARPGRHPAGRAVRAPRTATGSPPRRCRRTPLPRVAGRVARGRAAGRRRARCPCCTGTRPRTRRAGHDGRRARVQLRVDVFGSAFFMLTRYEELARRPARPLRPLPGGERRWPRRQGFLGTPIVDAYVELLWAALRRVWPRLRRRRPRVRGAADPRRGRPARHARPHAGAAGPPVRGRPACTGATSGSPRAGPARCSPPGAATTATTRTTPSTS